MDDKTLDEVERRLRGLLEFIDNERPSNKSPTPKFHTNPPAEVEKMTDYQEEVLNKCYGRSPGTEHPKRGFLAAIAYAVPRHLIMQSLAFMQDKRLDNLNMKKTPYKLESYYFATLRNLCKSNFIKTNIDWD